MGGFQNQKSIVNVFSTQTRCYIGRSDIRFDRIFIGLKIITKAIGSYEYSDITGDYKCENAPFLEKSNTRNNMIVPFTKNSQKGN